MKNNKAASVFLLAVAVALSSCGGNNPAAPDTEPTQPPMPSATRTVTRTATVMPSASPAAPTATDTPWQETTPENSATATYTCTIYAVDTATVTPTQITSDGYEPNDTEYSCVPVSPDTVYNASIYPLYDTDWYCISLSSAVGVSFTVKPSVTGTGINPVVYDENMNYVFGDYFTVSDGSGETQIRYAELSAGQYYVQVVDFMNFGVMGYDFEARIAGDPGFTATLTHTAGETFTATQSATQSAEDTWTPTPSATMTHTMEIAEDTFTPTMTETEIIFPDAYEFDDGCGFSQFIAAGGCQDRTIDGTDIDWLKLEILQHSLVTVETSGGAGGDTILDFYSDDCSGLLASDDDGGSTLYSRVQLSLLPGIYGIRVTARPQSGGGLYPYSICVSTEIFTPTFTVTSTVTNSFTPTVTVTATATLTMQDTPTFTATPTITVTMTATLSPTATDTALPGTVWLQAAEHAGFAERRNFGLAVFDRGSGDRMIVTGGASFFAGDLNDVYESSDGAVWTEVVQTAPYSQRNSHLTLSYDSRLWVIGGAGTATKSDVWYSYDGADWSMASTMTALGLRTSHAGAVFDPGAGARMYVIGGFKNGSLVSDVHSSQDGANWTQLTSSAAFGARYGHSAAVFDGRLWVSGGIDTYGGTCKNDVWYSYDGASWTLAAASAAFSPRYRHVMFAANGRLWITGGDNDTTTFEDCWYSYDGITWVKSADSAILARHSAAGAFFGGKMWVIGGVGKYNYTYGDEVLWSY